METTDPKSAAFLMGRIPRYRVRYRDENDCFREAVDDNGRPWSSDDVEEARKKAKALLQEHTVTMVVVDFIVSTFER